MSKGKRINATGRTDGEIKHVRLYPREIESPAYRSLSCKARSLYVELKHFCNGKNNGEIHMSIRRAADRLGTTHNTAHKALSELEQKGFIKPHVKGSFTWKERHATTWILTEFKFRDQPATQDYRKWQAAT
jgi:hypothetical protein